MLVGSLSLASLGFGGCSGGDSCGIGGAPAAGIVITEGATTLTFGGFHAGANNDCTPSGSQIISITIESTQTDGAGQLNLCVARPDQFKKAQGLGNIDPATPVIVEDAEGGANNCTYALDRSVAPMGTAKAEGICDDGTNAAGFALVLDGTLQLERTCGATVDSVSATVRGRVAVAAD